VPLVICIYPSAASIFSRLHFVTDSLLFITKHNRFALLSIQWAEKLNCRQIEDSSVPSSLSTRDKISRLHLPLRRASVFTSDNKNLNLNDPLECHKHQWRKPPLIVMNDLSDSLPFENSNFYFHVFSY